MSSPLEIGGIEKVVKSYRDERSYLVYSEVVQVPILLDLL
jgi:hypothetical protein